MKLDVEAITAETFAKVWEERGGVLLYPEDHAVVLRALKIAEALDAEVVRLEGIRQTIADKIVSAETKEVRDNLHLMLDLRSSQKTELEYWIGKGE